MKEEGTHVSIGTNNAKNGTGSIAKTGAKPPSLY